MNFPLFVMLKPPNSNVKDHNQTEKYCNRATRWLQILIVFGRYNSKSTLLPPVFFSTSFINVPKFLTTLTVKQFLLKKQTNLQFIIDRTMPSAKRVLSSKLAGRLSCMILRQNQISADSVKGNNTVFSENHTFVKPPF
jgi:hypothetical protein